MRDADRFDLVAVALEGSRLIELDHIEVVVGACRQNASSR